MNLIFIADIVIVKHVYDGNSLGNNVSTSDLGSINPEYVSFVPSESLLYFGRSSIVMGMTQ